MLVCVVYSVTQSCPTLCSPVDCSAPDSSVHGIFQARILEWVTISYPREFSWPMNRTWVSCISYRLAGRFFTTAPPEKPHNECLKLLKHLKSLVALMLNVTQVTKQNNNKNCYQIYHLPSAELLYHCIYIWRSYGMVIDIRIFSSHSNYLSLLWNKNACIHKPLLTDRLYVFVKLWSKSTFYLV